MRAAKDAFRAGDRFARLRVHSPHHFHHHIKWLCACDCGGSTFVTARDLRNGKVRSCGCLHREAAAVNGRANRKHGKSAAKIWTVWRNMRSRCNDPSHKSYARYGGRGISVCHEWAAFPDFLADMGEPPALGYQLDRINNDGPYCKSNCRWATASEQARNRRSSRLIAWSGESKVAAEWACDPRCSVSEIRIRDRLNKGWPVERAITAPLRHQGYTAQRQEVCHAE